MSPKRSMFESHITNTKPRARIALLASVAIIAVASCESPEPERDMERGRPGVTTAGQGDGAGGGAGEAGEGPEAGEAGAEAEVGGSVAGTGGVEAGSGAGEGGIAGEGEAGAGETTESFGLEARPENDGVCVAPATPEDMPVKLSELGDCFDKDDPWLPGPALIPYTMNSPLWSDGSKKARWMAIPDGETIRVKDDGDFEFPIGTILVKTFELRDVRLETRIMAKHDNGEWGAYDYVWSYRDPELGEIVDLDDPEQVDIPDLRRRLPPDRPGGVPFTWQFPSQDECMICHTEAAGFSIGPELLQLNGDHVFGEKTAHQLKTLDHIGLFEESIADEIDDIPELVDPADTTKSAEDRARSYLHANCAYCHRPEGLKDAPHMAEELINFDFRYQNRRG